MNGAKGKIVHIATGLIPPSFFRRISSYIFFGVACVFGSPICEEVSAGELSDHGGMSWSATWFAAQQSFSNDPRLKKPTTSFANQTYRQLMKVSHGGNLIRIKVSNLMGQTPLKISGVRIAISDKGSSIMSSTDRAITFDGQESVVIPSGEEFFSDAVSFKLPSLSTVAVSIFIESSTTLQASHSLGLQTNYIAAGNVITQSNLKHAKKNDFYAFITSIDVYNPAIENVVVCFGDSITDGYGSTRDKNTRYPDILSGYLVGSGVGVSVVNAGISGNRWLHDGVGPKGVDRFSRDVIGISGVTHVVALMGINDIGLPGLDRKPEQEVSADQIIRAITVAANAAHAKGIKFYSGTLTPYAITKYDGYYSAAGEIKRQAVNHFIRTTDVVDGFIDFDLTLRDPINVASLLVSYDSGDNLHPNDSGYAAMSKVAASFLRSRLSIKGHLD